MHTNSTSAGGAATEPDVPKTIAVAVEESGATEGVFEYVDPLPPTFPLDSLPTAIRQLATEGAASIGCPPEFIAGPALVAAAAAIGMSRVVEVTSSHREPPILFLAVVGEPGTAKSPAEAQALAPTMVRHSKLRVGDSGTMHAQADLYTTSPTVEGLAQLLNRNPRGVLVCPDELTGLIRSLDQYKRGRGNDRQQWLGFWSARPVKLDRKTADSIHVVSPCVNLVGGLNPDLLHELRDGRGAQDGFLERFLLVYPECHRPRYRPVPISAAAREKWAAVINRLYGLKPATEAPTWTPRAVTFSTEAADHYEWAVNELRARVWDGPLRAVGRKFEAYLARLALVLHYLRWAECAGAEGARIDDADIEVAIALLGYFLAQAERVHRQLPVALNDDEADTVIRWAKRQERGDLKVRDLQRSNCLARRGFSVVGQYQTVLGRLADRGLIVWGDKGTTFRLPS